MEISVGLQLDTVCGGKRSLIEVLVTRRGKQRTCSLTRSLRIQLFPL